MVDSPRPFAGSGSALNGPQFVVGSYNLANLRWRLTFDPLITAIPAVPTLSDWTVLTGGGPVSPTAINLLGATLNLVNAAYANTDTRVTYVKRPGEDYLDASGDVLQSFTHVLPS
jgi:hypothetical protein